MEQDTGGGERAHLLQEDHQEGEEERQGGETSSLEKTCFEDENSKYFVNKALQEAKRDSCTEKTKEKAW